MIKIERPSLVYENGKVIVNCKILINEVEKNLFYEIDEEYKQYLCIERSDAFVVAALYYAMKFHHDINCELPMTSELYHNITTFLIPTLAKHSDRFKNIKISVPITYDKIETYNAVGTGLSCGIDSFHVVKNYLDPECEDMKLTCFCLNNVGSFKAYNKVYRGIGADKAKDEITEKVIKVAQELKLPLIITNSNLSQVFPEVYYRVHTFSNMFSVLLMQKYFGKYYYASSGYDLAHYNVVDSPSLDSAEYDILTFYCLSTSNLKIYPEGNEKTRLEKTISIADFKPAQDHLHVCIKDSKNCGKCMKCRRTLLMLDAIGKLDNFEKVFDIKYYQKHKSEYMEWLKKEEKENHEMNVVTAKILKQKNGDTEYSDISEFNKRNIILPKLDIDSISIRKGRSILNKNAEKSYKTNLNLMLSVCIELVKLKKKKVRIPRYYLDNVKDTFKSKSTLRKKGGYIKNIIFNRKTRIELHDLIYFVLYRPETAWRISKFLVKEKIISSDILKLKNRTSVKDLVVNFEKFLDSKMLANVLAIEEVTIKARTLKSDGFVLGKKDIYYRGIYTKTFILSEKDRYYFLGKIGTYFVSVTNELNNDKNQIFEDVCQVKGLINKLD